MPIFTNNICLNKKRTIYLPTFNCDLKIQEFLVIIKITLSPNEHIVLTTTGKKVWVYVCSNENEWALRFITVTIPECAMLAIHPLKTIPC